MDEELSPAYYAARGGGWRDWWTLLHPPYTAWHLSYVVIGACLVPRPNLGRLLATLLAFFAAVGVGAHALDELHGRPLGTSVASVWLVVATVGGLLCAVVIGALAVAEVGLSLVPFIVAGPLLVVAYNAELFGGIVHTDAGFAAAWGSFPLLCSYVAQSSTLRTAPLLGAVAAFALSYAQRALSTPARALRRRTQSVSGSIRRRDGSEDPIATATLLAPLERALSALSWAAVFFACSLAVARLG